MRILGLDVGEKRIGVALSDELGVTAQGLQSLNRKSRGEDLDTLAKLAEERGIDEVVVGLPLNMNGSLSPGAKEVIKFVDELKEKLDVPIRTWDERLTTMQSERVLLEAGMGRKCRKAVLDKLAAQVILQSYLDWKAKQG